MAMKSSPKTKNGQDLACLKSLTRALTKATSLSEKAIFQTRLEDLIERLIISNRISVVERAIKALEDDAEIGANGTYNSVFLSEQLDAVCQTRHIEIDGETYNAELTIIPIIAWTDTGNVPAGPVDDKVYRGITKAFSQYIVDDDAEFLILPELYTEGQLLLEPIDVFDLSMGLAGMMFADQKPFKPDFEPDAGGFFVDTRFLIGMVVAPSGEPLYRWHHMLTNQTIEEAEEQAVIDWKMGAQPFVEKMLPNCQFQLLQPRAYSDAFQDALNRVRAYELIAEVRYLLRLLGLESGSLGAIIAGCGSAGDDWVTEYRISFYRIGSEKIIGSLVWLIYDREILSDTVLPMAFERDRALDQVDEDLSSLAEIFEILKSMNVSYEKNLVQRYECKNCPDCGGALFLDTHGEFVHVEPPEDLRRNATLH